MGVSPFETRRGKLSRFYNAARYVIANGGSVRIAVTGGAGYIGSVAVQRLVERGDSVTVIDNLVRGHDAALGPSASLSPIDICDGNAVLSILREHDIKAVLHFAALTIAPESMSDPAPYWRVNAYGTLQLLDAIREAGVEIVVLSSTAAVYGTPKQSPIPETAPLQPINTYGASKLAAERMLQTYSAAYGVRSAIFRYFNVAGASGAIGEDHRPETHLIPRALETAMGRAGPVSVYGTNYDTRDGTAIRDYVHVEDLIDAHLLALDLLAAGGQTLEPINLGTRDGASVLEVLDTIEQVTGGSVPRTFSDRRPGDPDVLIADSSRATAVLGWQPVRSNLGDIVRSAWEWRQKYPRGYPDNTKSA
jgi:UDP-glucose 4-epimerase